MSVSKAKCTKFTFRFGSARCQDSTEGAHSTPPNPLAILKGPTSKGREGRKGREIKGKGEGRGEEMEGRREGRVKCET